MRNRANSLLTFPTTNHKRFGLVIYFLIALFLAPVSARHIIGGVITYTCQGNGNYNFTMKIYRDFYGGGALFDDPAQVAVYQCGTNTPCDLLNVNNAIQVLSVPLSFPVIQIANPTYPCLLVPPNIQVEEGVYYFSLNLPQSPESYHIVYQRCCRNNTITNIYNPEDTGASFSVEITPAAQADLGATTADIDARVREVWMIRSKSGDFLQISVGEIELDYTTELGIDPGLRKDGVEAHLQALLAENPATFGEGWSVVQREYMTAIGPVDLLCRDELGCYVAVEVKRRGEIDGVEQLTRYLDLMNRDPLLGEVRGVFAAQQIKPQARTLATDRGISCLVVDYDALRGLDHAEDRLF